ncbi:hypothetical protein CMI37_34150 [Candidatus Pacearchaeota archaeon]|nr:hypothetical protein [Candidatus Pacearchaeota archaeon]
MPIYDYECAPCKVRREVYVTYEERDTIKCQRCQKAMERQISAPAIHVFKGGWYEHIADKPIYCETRSELSDACKRNDSISPDVENSSWLRSHKKERKVTIRSSQ